MKKLFTFLLVCSFCIAHGQLDVFNGNNGVSLSLADINGKSLLKEKYKPDVNGHPFFTEEWTTAELIVTTGKKYTNQKIKLNIESNEIYLSDSLAKVWILEKGIVKQLTLFPTTSVTDTQQLVFRCGYPPVEKQDFQFFYQVLSDGKIQLLKKAYKVIESSKNELTGERRADFMAYTEYYVFANGKIERIKKDRDFFLSLMQDKAAAINAYCSSNKISFKKIPDLQKLVGYYNGL